MMFRVALALLLLPPPPLLLLVAVLGLALMSLRAERSHYGDWEEQVGEQAPTQAGPTPVLSCGSGERSERVLGTSCIPGPTLGLSAEVGRDLNTYGAPTASLDPCRCFLRTEKRTKIYWPPTLSLIPCQTPS